MPERWKVSYIRENKSGTFWLWAQTEVSIFLLYTIFQNELKVTYKNSRKQNIIKSGERENKHRKKKKGRILKYPYSSKTRVMAPPVPAGPLPGRAWWGYSTAYEWQYCVSGWKRKETFLKMQYLPKDNMLVVLQGKTWKFEKKHRKWYHPPIWGPGWQSALWYVPREKSQARGPQSLLLT